MRSEITNQVAFCAELMERVNEHVTVHEKKRKSDGNVFNRDSHSYVANCRTYSDKSEYTAAGYSKTEIQADIKLLRRELMELSKMFDC